MKNLLSNIKIILKKMKLNLKFKNIKFQVIIKKIYKQTLI